MEATAASLQLPFGPEDTVSKVVFNSSSTKVAYSCWDSRVRIYSISENALVRDYSHIGPVLDCTFAGPSDEFVCSVGADKEIYLSTRFNLESGEYSIIGNHSDTIKCVGYSRKDNLLFTASYDKYICQWEVVHGGGSKLGPSGDNSPLDAKCSPLRRVELPELPHAMDIVDGRVFVACDNRLILVYSTDLLLTVQQRESSLKHPTRNIMAFPGANSFCTSSVEGRVSVDFLDEELNVNFPGSSNASASKRYAFKCHRETIEGVEYVYPVNALAAYPRWGTFATGGSDGFVNIWNRDSKRRLKILPKFSSTIASLAFSPDGKYLAVAASYVWDQGDLTGKDAAGGKKEPLHAVYVYPVYENDVHQIK